MADNGGVVVGRVLGMANQEQLVRLLQWSVDEWNGWRGEMNNWDAEIDLIRADLSDADLSRANLRNASLVNADLNRADLSIANLSNANLNDADLNRADLSNANLNDASLRQANLSGTNLSNANLSGADFLQTQALYTNFYGATLTRACIEDWHINSKTNLDGVICEYIYLDYLRRDRRPHDPDRNFEPGEFSRLFQIVQDSLSLYFKDGVDWQAAAYSFQSITTDGTPLDIEGVNKTKDGGVVITVNVPDSLDKGKVEGDFWKGYERHTRHSRERGGQLRGIWRVRRGKSTN